jgi:hypothetical protein
MFLWLKSLKNIIYPESPPTPAPMTRTDSFLGSGTPLSKYIAEYWECKAPGCLETNLQYNPSNLFATRKCYTCIPCETKNKVIKRYYKNMLMKKHARLRFQSFKTGDGLEQLVASMPDDQSLREWELHTLRNIRWKSNH